MFRDAGNSRLVERLVGARRGTSDPSMIETAGWLDFGPSDGDANLKSSTAGPAPIGKGSPIGMVTANLYLRGNQHSALFHMGVSESRQFEVLRVALAENQV